MALKKQPHVDNCVGNNSSNILMDRTAMHRLYRALVDAMCP